MSYEALVADSFRRKSPLPFSNENAAHARVIMKHVFLNADKRVALYSDALPGKVDTNGKSVEVYDWPELLEAAKQYLSSGDGQSKLDIKVRNPQENAKAASKGFIKLAEEFPEQVKIVWGQAPTASTNFIVNDVGAFRVELEEHQAIACAFNPEAAKILMNLYDEKEAALSRG